MVAFARLAIFGFIALTIIYFCLSIYSRAVRKGKLEEWWEEEGQPGDREEYIAAGLREYEGSLRRKLIWGGYVVPIMAIAAIIYFTNFH